MTANSQSSKFKKKNTAFFISATSVAMRTIVLADHLGINQLTRAFGMVALFQGAAFMTNAPLAGKIMMYFDLLFFCLFH